MTQIFSNNALTVVATGKAQASGAASAGTTLPVAADGNIPRYVRAAATAPACFRFGWGGVPTAVTTDLQIQPGDAVILSTNGASHFAVIQVSAAGVVQVSPLENC
jgi:hypothetical protein